MYIWDDHTRWQRLIQRILASRTAQRVFRAPIPALNQPRWNEMSKVAHDFHPQPLRYPAILLCSRSLSHGDNFTAPLQPPARIDNPLTHPAQFSKRNPHMVTRTKRFIAVRTLPGPQCQPLRHTLVAKGMPARLDDSVFEVPLAHVTIGDRPQQFILLRLAGLGLPTLKLAARVLERGFQFFDFEFRGAAGGGYGRQVCIFGGGLRFQFSDLAV